MARIHAGEYRHRVTITRTTRTAGQGSGTTTATIASRICCAVETLDGRERLQAQALSTTVSRRIRTRFRSGILAGDQVTWVNKGVTLTLQIVSVLVNDAQNEELHLLCEDAQA